MAGGAGCDEMAYKVAPQCPAGHSGCVPSEPLPHGDPETTSERTPAYATSVLSLGRLSADDSALHFELVDSKHGQVIATRRTSTSCCHTSNTGKTLKLHATVL